MFQVLRRLLPLREKASEVEVAVDKRPLHAVVPDEGYGHGHQSLRKDEEVVGQTVGQTLRAVHSREPFGQEKGAAGVEQNTHSPDKQVLHGDPGFPAFSGMKHPSVIDHAVRDASRNRADKGGIQVEEAAELGQHDGDQKVDGTCKPGRYLRLAEHPHFPAPMPASSSVCCHPVIHLNVANMTRP